METKQAIKWCCSACGMLWDESETYDYPKSTARVHTCGNLFCGAMCYKVTTPK